MKTAYLDCFSGISGDMLLGALVSAGLPEEVLRDSISALKMEGVALELTKVNINGIDAVGAKVRVQQSQSFRFIKDIEILYDNSALDLAIMTKCLAVFRRLAEAEAAVHGCLPEEVHFHEVGAADAIVDITASVAGFSGLDIGRLVCSPMPMSSGWVQCEHGILPVPAPAVLQLLKGVPVYGEMLDQELVTPTGAALVAVLADDFGSMPPMILDRTGYGAGSLQRNDGRPNMLRLVTGDPVVSYESQQVEVIETHLDDWNPEVWPYVAEKLLNSGALDVSLTPMQMKKGRPGFMLRVICDPSGSLRTKEIVFSETSAIGVRFRTEQRMTLPRKSIMITTNYGNIRAKEIITPTGVVVTPEYEDCCKMARKLKVPLKEIYEAVSAGSGNQD